MFWLTTGILGAWVLWALVDVSTDVRFPSFRSFGLISPLVGFLCLLVSLAALREASRHRAGTWQALGASVLAKYASTFPENPLLSIPAYNAGQLNPRRWLRERPNADFDIWVELIPYLETRRYVKRVLSSRAAYAFLYRREDFESFATFPNKVQ